MNAEHPSPADRERRNAARQRRREGSATPPPTWMLLFLALVVLVPGTAACADDPPPKPPPADIPLWLGDEPSYRPLVVLNVMGRARAWLQKRQRSDGSWGGLETGGRYATSRMPGLPPEPRDPVTLQRGLTALAVYTLLRCGLPRRDPSVRRALEFLLQKPWQMGHAMEVSMMLLAVTATGKRTGPSIRDGYPAGPWLQQPYLAWAHRLRVHLLDLRVDFGWGYGGPQGSLLLPRRADLASTHLAALALFTAHYARIRTDRAVWEDLLRYTLEQQDPTGPPAKLMLPGEKVSRACQRRGFAYRRGSSDESERLSRRNMTACGVMMLEMARYVLAGRGRRRATWDRRVDAARVQQAIYDGLAWLQNARYDVGRLGTEPSTDFDTYWLFTLAGAMDLLGLEGFAGGAWRRGLGQTLINKQHENGSWLMPDGAVRSPVAQTCFALLFLARAHCRLIPHRSPQGGSVKPPVPKK